MEEDGKMGLFRSSPLKSSMAGRGLFLDWPPGLLLCRGRDLSSLQANDVGVSLLLLWLVAGEAARSTSHPKSRADAGISAGMREDWRLEVKASNHFRL